MVSALHTGGDARARETAHTVPVYGQLPFVPKRCSGCDIHTTDGRQILDLYGGHAVAALGYGHPKLLAAIQEQSNRLLFQSNAVALDVRADAAEKLTQVAPQGLDKVFFVNSGAEANENALRLACMATGRSRVLAIERGFHGRTAAAAAVTWRSDRWYGFPRAPFRRGLHTTRRLRNGCAGHDRPDTVAAVIFEPVQGVAGALRPRNGDFVRALREETIETRTHC